MITSKEFLREVEKEGIHEDLHITRNFSSLIAVSDGEVIKITDPWMKYCPLAERFGLNIDEGELTENIASYMEEKIDEFGFFRKDRNLEFKDVAVPYGASEMMMYDLKQGDADAAVVVCDGAGTVITDNPYLIQGIGARMNGLFYTTQIDKVINGIEKKGGYVPFPGEIDQKRGVEKAINQGYETIDVTVSEIGEGNKMSEIREIEDRKKASVRILSLCNTGISDKKKEEIRNYADLTWSCASKTVREGIGPQAAIQVATRIPVFGLGFKSLDLLGSYSSKRFKQYIGEHEPPYLVSGKCRVFNSVDNWEKIRMDGFETYIGQADSLPIRVEDEPKPLI